MKVLGIIPARKGSLRFADKHHALILGKPMFAYTIEAALQAKLLDRLVISSNDPDLKTLASSYGVEFIERPAELATDTAALDDAIRHACRYLQQRDGFQPDAVVVMQGNVPVRKEGQIDEAIRRLEALPEATAICTVEEIRQRPEWALIIKDERTSESAPFIPGPVAYRKQDFPRLFSMDGAIHAVRWQTLFENEGNNVAHAWFGKRIHLLIQDHPMYSLEVDYPDQVAMAVFYLLYQRYGDQWYQDLIDKLES